jgi:hypothetical protein
MELGFAADDLSALFRVFVPFVPFALTPAGRMV